MNIRHILCPPEPLTKAQMSQQDKNYQPNEVTLATFRWPPPSCELLTLDQVPQNIVPGGVSLLDDDDILLLCECSIDGAKFPSSEKDFEDSFWIKSNKKCLECYVAGIKDVG